MSIEAQKIIKYIPIVNSKYSVSAKIIFKFVFDAFIWIAAISILITFFGGILSSSDLAIVIDLIHTYFVFYFAADTAVRYQEKILNEHK